MIADNNRKASIIAYFLSKFDRDAMKYLGYGTLVEVFDEISEKLGKSNQYLKLRRDEFDVLTGSHRVGFNKRNPNPVVTTFHNGLNKYSFEELSKIVTNILIDEDENYYGLEQVEQKKMIVTSFTEEEYELIINGKDNNAKLKEVITKMKTRVFDPKIQNNLKKLYEYRCQICGSRAYETYNVDISEAHHIDPFVTSINNNAKNIIVLCPDHHRVIHKAQPIFNRELMNFDYANGKTDSLMYNVHL